MTRKAKEWYPAIYARLSDEDTRSGVSLSIENQIDILKKYVEENGWHSPKVFYDDDKTGTDFNRKGFQDMYAEAENGNINVIVIKDTSRFGRNWIKSGDYFERIEEMDIRFISLQEGIDTIDPKCPALKMLPFYFVFNEWHSATTSEKIKTVLENNAKKGEYRCVTPPYGYYKDPNNNHKLLVDPNVAPVIKRIFDLRLHKNSISAIIRILNEDGIPSPNAYRTVNSEVKRHGKWCRDNLQIIFRNPVYCGDTANGKRKTVSYKNHKCVRQPISNWIIVKDTHEPIVPREVWEKCYNMFADQVHIRSTKENKIPTFSGLLRCADCGAILHRSHSNYTTSSGEKHRFNNYNCSLHHVSKSAACSNHQISEKNLMKLVCADIRKKANNVLLDENVEKERFYNIKSKLNNDQLKADKILLKKANKRIDDLDNLIQSTFEKHIIEVLSFDILKDLTKKYEAEKKELKEKVEQLTFSIDSQSKIENDIEQFIMLIKKYMNITELDRQTAVELIDHITVSASSVQPRQIVIYYNYLGDI